MIYNKKKYEDCSYPKKDCAACVDGKCMALYDTSFKNKLCPFYMDKATKAKRVSECKERIFRRGFIIRKSAN